LLLLLLLLFFCTLGSKDPEGLKLIKRLKTNPLVARGPILVESCRAK